MSSKPSLLQLLSQPRNETRAEFLVPFPELWSNSYKKEVESEEEEEEIDDFDAIPRLAHNKKDEWSAEETRKWLQNRKARFPILQNIQKIRDDDEYDMGVMERKLRMKLELLKGTDENDHILRKRAKYIKDLATVQRIKRKKEENKYDDDHKNADQTVDEVPNPQEQIPEQKQEIKKSEVLQPRTKEEIIAHLKQRVREDESAIVNFVDNKLIHSSNYRYIQNTLFSNLVLDDVLQERENIMSIIEYIYENNYLQN